MFRWMLLLLGLSMWGWAQTPYPPTCSEYTLPTTDSQYPSPQQVLLCRPENWNGQLVIYAHGYKAPSIPPAIPLDDLNTTGSFWPSILLQKGFAFATTSYRKNGFFVFHAIEDINALTYFFVQTSPSKPQRIYLIGNSEGGLVITLLLERFPQLYSGGLSLGAPLGGLEAQIQYVTDFRVVFDYFFPEVFEFRATQVPEVAQQNWDQYASLIRKLILHEPQHSNQLFRITRAAKDPTNIGASMAQTTLDTLWYNLFGTNDFIQTLGGFPYDNRNTQYAGSRDNPALNAGVERLSANPAAAEALQRLQTSGDLHRPLVSLHNLYDPVVPFRQELLYLEQVGRNSHTKMLSLWPIARYGHCRFTPEELLEAFELLVLEGMAQGSPQF